MNRYTLAPPLLMTLMAAFPSGSAWGSSSAAPAMNLAPAQSTSTALKFSGPLVNMRWGPVQVTIKVKGRKVVNASATAPMDRSRSAFINGQALPLLKQELLHAQSANISAVSGATMTSAAYIQSLQGALRKAHL